MAPRNTSRTRVTMSQVAAYCGVARSTVSGILSGRADCFASLETRQRVLEAVAALGYRPNLQARSLARGRTSTIGVISTALDVEPTAMVCMTLEQLAREHGYLTLMSFNPNDPAVENRLLQWLHDRCVDGVLVFPCEHGDHDELNSLVRSGFPVVTIDGAGRTGLTGDDVSVDHFAGGRLQAEHLIERGRRRIWIANSLQTCHVVEQRIAGLEAGLRQAGCPEPVRMNLSQPARPNLFWKPDDYRMLRQLIVDQYERFDAIVAVGDDLAMAVLGLLLELGVDVPGRLAVIGYDGARVADNTVVPLTTIANPACETAEKAFELLIGRIEGKYQTSKPRRIRISPQLVTRVSTIGRTARELLSA